MDFQIGERKTKNCKQKYTIPHAGNIFKLVHTTGPYGGKTPGHAADTNRREKKTLRLLLVRSALHAQG